MMNLLQTYSAVLNFSGFCVDNDGRISTTLARTKKPFVIDDKRMVVPTKERLAEFNYKEEDIFHPLNESIVRGESDLVTRMKDQINLRLNYTIACVGLGLLRVAASSDDHKKLSPEQMELVIAVKDADNTMVNNFVKVMTWGAKNKGQQFFTNIYLKKGGTYEGKKNAYVGIVRFPYYQELMEGKDEHNLRVTKDIPSFKALFEYMFPNLETTEEYNYGSMSRVAPCFESLIMTAAKIAFRLNELIHLFKSFIDDADDLVFDDSWLRTFENLNSLKDEIHSIPIQNGVRGETYTIEERQAALPVAQPQQLTTYQVNPPAAEIKTTKNGVDFKSLMASRPDLQALQMPQGHPQQQMMYQQQPPQRRVPGWAAAGAPQGPAPGSIVRGSDGMDYQIGPQGQMIPMQPMMYQATQQHPTAGFYGQPQPQMQQPQQGPVAGIASNGAPVWIYPNGAMTAR
jgi:hypothetical protein